MLRIIFVILFIFSGCTEDKVNLKNLGYSPGPDVEGPPTTKRLNSDEKRFQAIKDLLDKKELEELGELDLPPACECCWIRSGNCTGPAGEYCLSEGTTKTFFCARTQQYSKFSCIFVFGEGCFGIHEYGPTMIAGGGGL